MPETGPQPFTPSTKQELLTKIENRSLRAAVIGLGYVGLPLAVALAQAGFQVVGLDVDVLKVQSILNRESYVGDVPSATLAGLVESELIHASTDFSEIARCQAVSVCVPTPLRKTRDPDVSFVIAAAESIGEHLAPGSVVVLESTTYPGTTREVILPRLQNEERGLRAGETFFLAFSPERVDPGRQDWTTRNTPKVLGGLTPDCLDVAAAFYGAAIDTIVRVSSPEAAEMAKLLENTFRSVNIGLANEVLLMCDQLGLNAWEVIEAAATKPFGFMKFTPGPGLGGHCIPIDPLYLSWRLKAQRYTARFIELASEINAEMPEYWVRKIQDALNEAGRAVNGSKILILGMAYKADIEDVRESPALDIAHLLIKKGADVRYHDPHVPSVRDEEVVLISQTDLVAALRECHCAVIATDHSAYDWDLVTRESTLLIDTRNAVRGQRAAG